MSEVFFKFGMGAKCRCKVTGFKGQVIAMDQSIVGTVQYGLQPPCKKGSNYVPEALMVDEQSLELATGDSKSFTHKFGHDTGDRVRHRVSGFEGIIVKRRINLNGCEDYRIEGKLDKDGKEVAFNGWLPEIEKLDDGLNKKPETKIEKKRTGGPSRHERLIHPLD